MFIFGFLFVMLYGFICIAVNKLLYISLAILTVQGASYVTQSKHISMRKGGAVTVYNNREGQ